MENLDSKVGPFKKSEHVEMTERVSAPVRDGWAARPKYNHVRGSLAIAPAQATTVWVTALPTVLPVHLVKVACIYYCLDVRVGPMVFILLLLSFCF